MEINRSAGRKRVTGEFHQREALSHRIVLMQISLELNNILEGGSGIGFIEMIGATEKSDNGS